MKNWTYDVTHHVTHPHAIVFDRCATSGIHQYMFMGLTGTTQWCLNETVRTWLDDQFGKDVVYDALVPYAVSFRHKHDAMMFKLTYGQ